MKITISILLVLLIASGCAEEGINGNKMLEAGSSINESLEGEKIEHVELIKSLTPTGFAGSSLNRIDLYANGDIYWVQYDGNGFREENIVKNELIAKNAENIECINEETISIIGEKLEVVSDGLANWIEFKK